MQPHRAARPRASVVAAAAVGWFIPGIWGLGAIAGLVLAFVNIFHNRKKLPSAGLTLAYAAAQGLFIGGISRFYEDLASGVVVQAVIGTIVVVGVTLALFASGKIRASAKATKVFLIAMIGYLLFSAVNLLLIVFGANDDPWGLNGSFHIFGIPLGLVIGVLVVIMCAYSLVLEQFHHAVADRRAVIATSPARAPIPKFANYGSDH